MAIISMYYVDRWMGTTLRLPVQVAPIWATLKPGFPRTKMINETADRHNGNDNQAIEQLRSTHVEF